MSTSGVGVAWMGEKTKAYSEEARPSLVQLTKDSASSEYFQSYSIEYNEEVLELHKNGLGAVHTCFAFLTSASLDDDTVSLASSLTGLITLPGYIRSNPMRAIVETQEVADLQAEPSESMLKSIEEEARMLVTMAKDADLLPHEKKFKEVVLTSLTARSSGGFRLTIPFSTKDGEFVIKTNAKDAVFLADPQFFMSTDLDVTEPDRDKRLIVSVGSRDVAGRKERIIYPGPLTKYVRETMLFPLVSAASLMVDYALSKNTGVTSHDFGGALKIFGSPAKSGQTVSIDLDFSSFDATIGAWMRTAFVNGLMRGFDQAIGLETKYGTNTLAELLDIAVGRLAYNPPTYVVDNLGRKEEVTVHGVTSGEAVTNLLDTIVNKANWHETRVELERLVEEGRLPQLYFETISVMGDDISVIAKVARKLTAEEFRLIRETSYEVAKKSGLVVNKVKASVSPLGFTFLKNTFIHGARMPVREMTYFSSEGKYNHSDFPTLFSGMESKIATMGSRGYNTQLLQLFLYFCFSLKRTIRRGPRLGGGFIYAPILTLFLPSAEGGIGSVPRMPYGATSMVSVHLAEKQGLIREYRASASIMKIYKEDWVKRLATNIVKEKSDGIVFGKSVLRYKVGDTLVEREEASGQHPFGRGLSFIASTLDKVKVFNSRAAMDDLKGIGVTRFPYIYENGPIADLINVLTTALMANQAIDDKRQEKISRSVMRVYVKPPSVERPMPSERVTQMLVLHTFDMKLPADRVNPYLGLNYPEANAFKILGPRSDGSRPFSNMDIIRILRKGDHSFPRNVSSVTLVAIISHPAAFSPTNLISLLVVAGANVHNAGNIAARFSEVQARASTTDLIRGNGLTDSFGMMLELDHREIINRMALVPGYEDTMPSIKAPTLLHILTSAFSIMCLYYSLVHGSVPLMTASTTHEGIVFATKSLGAHMLPQNHHNSDEFFISPFSGI
jgi:hypothetical protein